MLIQAYSLTHHMGKAMKATGFCQETCYSYLRQPGKIEEFKKAIEAPMFARIDELGEECRDWRAKAWCLERTMPETLCVNFRLAYRAFRLGRASG